MIRSVRDEGREICPDSAAPGVDGRHRGVDCGSEPNGCRWEGAAREDNFPDPIELSIIGERDEVAAHIASEAVRGVEGYRHLDVKVAAAIVVFEDAAHGARRTAILFIRFAEVCIDD